MATLFGQPIDIGSDKHSIVDDFMYGSNVASSHVYIRLGTVCLTFPFFNVDHFATVEGNEGSDSQCGFLNTVSSIYV